MNHIFYCGSMNVSYGVGIAVAVAVFVLLKLFALDFDSWGIFLSIVTGLVLSMPYIAALYRSIGENIFFKFDGNIAENNK